MKGGGEGNVFGGNGVVWEENRIASGSTERFSARLAKIGFCRTFGKLGLRQRVT